MSILRHLFQDIAWRKNVSAGGHVKGVGHIGEAQREGELVATALCLNITFLPVHSAQFGNGVEGKMTCEEGKQERSEVYECSEGKCVYITYIDIYRSGKQLNH